MFLTTCRHYFHIWLLYSFFSKLNVAKLNYGRQKVIYFVCVSACTTGKLSVTSKHKKFTKCNVSVSEILLFGKVSPAKFPVLPIYRMDNAIFFCFVWMSNALNVVVRINVCSCCVSWIKTIYFPCQMRYYHDFSLSSLYLSVLYPTMFVRIWWIFPPFLSLLIRILLAENYVTWQNGKMGKRL